MSTTDDPNEDARRHLERFKAPDAIRQELTELITRAGSLVWTREGLTADKRSLATISALIAQGHLGPLREHIEIGLGNGLTAKEITEVIIHCGIYAGFPRTVAAMEVAADVFAALGVEPS